MYIANRTKGQMQYYLESIETSEWVFYQELLMLTSPSRPLSPSSSSSFSSIRPSSNPTSSAVYI